MWTRIRAGKPRAPGMSKDTGYRVRGTLAAPLPAGLDLYGFGAVARRKTGHCIDESHTTKSRLTATNL